MQKYERPIAIVEDKDQRSWHVHVTLRSGAPMDVTGFKNEPDAKAWIESAAWLREVLTGNMPEGLRLLPVAGASAAPRRSRRF